MLVLGRKIGQSVMIGNNIRVVLIDIRGSDKVGLGFEAPKDVKILRQEIFDTENKDKA